MEKEILSPTFSCEFRDILQNNSGDWFWIYLIVSGFKHFILLGNDLLCLCKIIFLKSVQVSNLMMLELDIGSKLIKMFQK